MFTPREIVENVYVISFKWNTLSNTKSDYMYENNLSILWKENHKISCFEGFYRWCWMSPSLCTCDWTKRGTFKKKIDPKCASSWWNICQGEDMYNIKILNVKQFDCVEFWFKCLIVWHLSVRNSCTPSTWKHALTKPTREWNYYVIVV